MRSLEATLITIIYSYLEFFIHNLKPYLKSFGINHVRSGHLKVLGYKSYIDKLLKEGMHTYIIEINYRY